jgi:hypothetical protein
VKGTAKVEVQSQPKPMGVEASGFARTFPKMPWKIVDRGVTEHYGATEDGLEFVFRTTADFTAPGSTLTVTVKSSDPADFADPTRLDNLAEEYRDTWIDAIQKHAAENELLVG